ncbi:MAG: rhombosortase [Candidatus Thiodiazotropha sp. 6PLUC2]
MAQTRITLPAKTMICPLAISLVCLGLALFSATLSELLQYHRGEIDNGEWWRLLTAHLVHLGWGHLLMNLIGMWFIWYLFLTNSRICWCSYIFIPLIIGTSAGLWFFTPELIWYRGLSGALHGLLIWALLRHFSSEPRLSAALLLGLVIKIGWEQWHGPMPGSESLANGRVVVESHLYGALSGVLVWIVETVLKTINNGKTSD